MLKKIKEPYQGVFKIVKRYWQIYGGWYSFVLSPYLHISLILTILMSHFWLTDAWWDTAISILPSIIGFSLGGYAIWLGFGDEKFRNIISEINEASGFSPYLQVSATFVHFIIVQLLALCLALVAKATHFPITDVPWLYNLLKQLNFQHGLLHAVMRPLFYGFGFLLLIYAIMTAVAATLAVFRVANWFDTIKNQKKK